MAGAVDVVSHTEIERGRNGNTVLHSSYTVTSVTLCSWRPGGWGGLPTEFMAICDSSSEMELQDGIFFIIFFIILNILFHQTTFFFFKKKREE